MLGVALEELLGREGKGRVALENGQGLGEDGYSSAAFFDVANGFPDCIAGLHEVLRRQGLLEGIWCLDENEGLNPGQREEIDRVYAAYPLTQAMATMAGMMRRIMNRIQPCPTSWPL